MTYTFNRLQNANVSTEFPTDGYVLTYDGYNDYWAPRPASTSNISFHTQMMTSTVTVFDGVVSPIMVINLQSNGGIGTTNYLAFPFGTPFVAVINNETGSAASAGGAISVVPIIALQSGTSASITSYGMGGYNAQLSQSGVDIGPSYTGSNNNIGVYELLIGNTSGRGNDDLINYTSFSILSPTDVAFNAIGSIPDVNNGSITWATYSYNTNQQLGPIDQGDSTSVVVSDGYYIYQTRLNNSLLGGVYTQSGGDVVGVLGAPKVVGLQGFGVDSTSPTEGQVLTYDNTTKWTPKIPTIPSYSINTTSQLTIFTDQIFPIIDITLTGTVQLGNFGGFSNTAYLAFPSGIPFIAQINNSLTNPPNVNLVIFTCLDYGFNASITSPQSTFTGLNNVPAIYNGSNPATGAQGIYIGNTAGGTNSGFGNITTVNSPTSVFCSGGIATTDGNNGNIYWAITSFNQGLGGYTFSSLAQGSTKTIICDGTNIYPLASLALAYPYRSEIDGQMLVFNSSSGGWTAVTMNGDVSITDTGISTLGLISELGNSVALQIEGVILNPQTSVSPPGVGVPPPNGVVPQYSIGRLVWENTFTGGSPNLTAGWWTISQNGASANIAPDVFYPGAAYNTQSATRFGFIMGNTLTGPSTNTAMGFVPIGDPNATGTTIVFNCIATFRVVSTSGVTENVNDTYVTLVRFVFIDNGKTTGFPTVVPSVSSSPEVFSTASMSTATFTLQATGTNQIQASFTNPSTLDPSTVVDIQLDVQGSVC